LVIAVKVSVSRWKDVDLAVAVIYYYCGSKIKRAEQDGIAERF
jgi:hypothetical protein